MQCLAEFVIYYITVDAYCLVTVFACCMYTIPNFYDEIAEIGRWARNRQQKCTEWTMTRWYFGTSFTYTNLKNV